MNKLANLTGNIEDYRALRNLKNRLTRSINADNKLQIESASEDNVWRASKKLSAKSSYIPTRIVINNKIFSIPREIATEFNDLFNKKNH